MAIIKTPLPWPSRGGAPLLLAVFLPLLLPPRPMALATADDTADVILPTLAWPAVAPSDWLNVVTACGAKGDGKADDTKALQACFTMVSGKEASPHISAVYLPRGTYRITSTLTIARSTGGLLVGDGETTRLLWDGARGGVMLVSEGLTRMRFVGLHLDGASLADVGIEHDAHSTAPYYGFFETRIRHQNNKFANFGVAGIRVGFHTGTGKLETSEVLYENNVFLNCGRGPACMSGQNPHCGGVALLNFNDYDNAFDGCHFVNNSRGVVHDKMANSYVRNCFFSGSTVVDIQFAASAGNSVRRCVSVGSAQFVLAPPHTAVSPTTIQDCRVYAWTGGRGAVAYNLRGPLLLLDNEFYPAAGSGYHAAAAAAPVVTNAPWGQTNQVLAATGNLVNGTAASVAALLGKVPSNVFPYDIGGEDPGSTVPRTPLNASTRFLKGTWPVPTSFVDAAARGCNGTRGLRQPDTAWDATACVQATIDEARTRGKGAAAYFPRGQYPVNRTITIDAGDYAVLGSGFESIIAWRGTAQPDSAAVLVRGGGGGLRVEQLSVVGLQVAGLPAKDPPRPLAHKLVHDGSAAAATASASAGTTKARTTFYDGVYTSDAGSQLWYSPGLGVRNLRAGDVLHAVHVDGNMDVADSADGTVLLGFFIQGSLNVSGAAAAGSQSRDYPPLGALTAVGLTDHDLNVLDDQSVVVTDFYCEQIKTGHLYLSGSGSRGGDGSSVREVGGASGGGRVTVSGVKAGLYESDFMTVENYHGSVVYMQAFFMTESRPYPVITQRGSAECDITVLANAFWGNNSAALQWRLASGATGHTAAVGNLLADYGSATEPTGQVLRYPDTPPTAAATASVAAALDDLRRLGRLDLLLNHP